MAINKYEKHLLILSEDIAYQDIAVGFVNHIEGACRRIKIVRPAGGWKKLLEIFSQEYVSGVRQYENRHVLLLLDLDGRPERYSGEILGYIPDDINNRVFVLSCMDEAENFKKEMGTGKSEAIGVKLAESCFKGEYADSDSPWMCPQLLHNEDELNRLATAVRPFLF